MSSRDGTNNIESWWRIKPGEPCHERLVAYGKLLRQTLRPAHLRDRAGERIYENEAIKSYGSAVRAIQQAGIAPTLLNVAKSVIDTFESRISKKRPMPQFSISDADWGLKRKARQYRKFLVGKMTETEFDRLSPLALSDSCCTRAGLTAIYAGDEDVVAEQLYANELLIDPREAQYGRPWQAIRTRRVSRDWLADKYPKQAGQIRSAPSSMREPWESNDIDTSAMLDLGGYVDVYEAWRLPSCGDDDEDDEDTDGRHVMCLDGVTLYSEPWRRQRFPIARMVYNRRKRDWWGVPLMKGLAALQGEINKIVRDIQMNLEVTGKVVILEQEQFASPVEMLAGARPMRIKHKGINPPQWHVPEPVSQGQVMMLEKFIQNAYELCGMSQAMAHSRSSLGLNASGIALDTQYDIDSERLSKQETNYANYRLDAAQCYLDAAQDIARARAKEKGSKRSRSYYANYTTGGRMEKIDFADVELKDGEYKLQLEPVNFLPDTRAGKLSAVQELTKAGVIPQWMAGALFDEPDLAKANGIAFADYHNLERILDDVGDEEIDLAELMPEGYHNLDLFKVMSRAYYNRAQAEYAPESIQDRYRTICDAVTDMIKTKKQQEAAMAPPPMPMGPGGPPMMPPNGAPIPGVPGAPMPPMPPPPVSS